MGAGPLVVTFPLTGRNRAIVEEELGGAAEAIYLVNLAPAARVHVLGRAGAVLSHDTSKELRPDEIPLIRHARLLQFTAAGVDWVPTRDLPRELPVAANKGGGAEPMSEHIVALALAAAKRLFIEHANLNSGEFNQSSANRMLRGGVCGILGFGNVGVATARLMRAFGMKIHAINRRGASHEPTDWIATTVLLDEMLRVADVLVISAALTTATAGLIGARELGLMKENAILINVARGDVIDEAALYEHLVSHPESTRRSLLARKRSRARVSAVLAETRSDRRHKRSENQVHRTRVREVRIQFPPADSPSLSGFRLGSWESPGFAPVWRRSQAVRSAETRKVQQHRAEER